jgi:UDP-glucuronate 4-epimerase
MRCLVTGTAGFIGFHLAKRLLDLGHAVVGFDGMTPYYDVTLKQARHRLLQAYPGFTPREFMLEDAARLGDAFEAVRPEIVIHLAAQAGVRYSLENPRAYVDANLIGTFNLIEACRACPVQHLLMASTSSAYGGNDSLPFRETDRVAWPLTLYAASKIGTEVMAHAYAHLWNIPTTVFRFFTVYGPWGRPDMALFKFTQNILEDKPVEIFNHGRSTRDFTYIDDLVESVVRLTGKPPAGQQASSWPGDTMSPVAPYRIVNIGGGQPVDLMSFVDEIERALGRTARRVYKPMPAGDVAHTMASTDLLRELTGFVPTTPVSVGVPSFVAWYREYYGEGAASSRRSHAKSSVPA